MLILYALWAGVFIHDWHLKQFGRIYSAIQHPPGTKHIRSYSKLGLLIGNGDHCDYFVGELRSYSGDRKTVLKKYATQSFWSSESQENIPVEVLFIDHGKVHEGIVYCGVVPSDLPSPVEDIVEDARKMYRKSEHLYIVYIFDQGYGPGFDMRCL